MRALVFLALAACTPSTPDPVVAPATSASASSAPAAAAPNGRAAPCTPWGNPGFSAYAFSVSGRADFKRELRFDDAKGIVSVHDSDPYANASGKEEKTPRVIDKTKTLTPEEHRALTVDLFQICPDTAAMAEKCAPGGCVHLEVTSEGKTVTVESVKTVGAVMRRLESYFPELRTSQHI